MTLPELEIAVYNPTYPSQFYLPGGDVLEPDAVLVVEGRELPVHSQLLSLKAGVLGGLFQAASEGPATTGTWPPRWG